MLLVPWAEAASKAGIIVEEVTEHHSGHRAGLKPGDVILSWRREASPPANPTEARGEIRSWFDLLEVEVEESARGKTWLHGLREGVPFAVVVPPGKWLIETRPVSMPRDLDALYEEGSQRIKIRELEQGTAVWRQAAALAEKEKRWELASWLLARVGAVWTAEMKWSEVDAAYRRSAELAEGHGLPPSAATMWVRSGNALRNHNAFVEATASFERALMLGTRHRPESLLVAGTLMNLANAWSSRRELRKTEELLTQALEMVERLAPGSYLTRAVVQNLGNTAGQRGDLDSQERYYRELLALSEKLDLGDLTMSEVWLNVSGLAIKRGNLPWAEELLTKTLSTLERVAPEGHLIRGALNNLALVVMDQGDVAAAEKLLKRSLQLEESRSPDTWRVTAILSNLGCMARSRGDLDAAESYHRRSLSIREKLAPDSADVAGSWLNLATVAMDRADWTSAEERYRKALPLLEKHRPGSLEVALTLEGLGFLAKVRREYTEAERIFTEALSISERLSPGSLAEVRPLVNLADLAKERQDPVTAETRLRRALAIVQKLSPGTSLEAECLSRLGEIRRSSGRLGEAEEFLRQAVAALETQRGRVDTSEETRATFAARHADTYRSYVEVLVESNQAAEAFHALERSRARSFLARLAERDIVFDREIPAELERERRAADAAYDRTQALLAEVDPKDQARIDALLSQFRDRKTRQDEIARRIREASPHLAALKYPEPLDVPRVQQSLETGTILLSYSVGPKKTLLFVVSASPVSRKPLAVYTVAVDRDTLRSEVQALRDLIARPGPAGDAFYAQARRLFARLIAPARKEIAGAKRVVICPDDQLHALPFGALHDKKQGFLIQWKPLHLAASATVYAELLRSRDAALGADRSFLGFGNPTYADRDMTARLHLTPLPGTRREVQELAALFGDRAVVYAGDEATEERVKSLDREARYLHFACHGFVDDRFPLNSGLALTMPEKPAEGRENGLLQAWEIIEQVRIRADLVSLSACETGLGQEVAGEGILGLTRAFQFSGAQSVLASLWSVPDKATTRLMTRFYGYLQQGYSKDAALRAAQIDLIEGGRPGGEGAAFKQPFAWAAFQLVGDWR